MMKTKKRSANTPPGTLPPDLTDIETHLLQQMQLGYQLETGMLGTGPLLRDTKTKEVIRPMSANLNTVKALEERGLIRAIKSRDPLLKFGG